MKTLSQDPRGLAFNYSMMALGMAAALGVNELPQVHEDYSGFEHGRVLAYNASQFAANAPVEFLSNYAVRYSDPLANDLIGVRQMLAPDIAVGNRMRFVQYPVYLLQDAFLALDNPIDDIRGIGADFPTLRNTTKTLTTQKIQNRGIAIEVDEDEELLDEDWQQRKVAYLRGILDRTALVRALGLFVGTATAKTLAWNAGAGQDPDQALLLELENALVRPNRILMGPGAATKRRLAHRAQNTAGGFASAGLSDDGIANYLSLDKVMTVRNRVTSGAGTTSSIFNNFLLLFLAGDAMQKDDMSNLKTFWAPCNNGQRYAVYVRQVGDKRWRIAVEKYELTSITATAGAEVITITS